MAEFMPDEVYDAIIANIKMMPHHARWAHYRALKRNGSMPIEVTKSITQNLRMINHHLAYMKGAISERKGREMKGNSSKTDSKKWLLCHSENDGKYISKAGVKGLADKENARRFSRAEKDTLTKAGVLGIWVEDSEIKNRPAATNTHPDREWVIYVQKKKGYIGDDGVRIVPEVNAQRFNEHEKLSTEIYAGSTWKIAPSKAATLNGRSIKNEDLIQKVLSRLTADMDKYTWEFRSAYDEDERRFDRLLLDERVLTPVLASIAGKMGYNEARDIACGMMVWRYEVTDDYKEFIEEINNYR